MNESTPRTPARELAQLMRQLRVDRAVSGTALATALGVGFSQSKISRIEKGGDLAGGLTPTPMDAGRIAWQLRAPRQDRRRAIGLALQLSQERVAHSPLRIALQSGSPRVQQRIREREARSGHLATFHPAMVPAMLQTLGYRESIADSGPTPPDPALRAEWLLERAAREAHRATRPATQVVTEGALCWGPAGAAAMIEQCEHIARLIGERPHWTIGVIPRIVAAGAAIDYPPNGFDLYDEDSVLVGTTAGNALVTDRATVDSHIARLARLRRLAVYGSAAREVLARVAREYLALTR